MNRLLLTFLAIFCWGFFVYIVFNVKYPESLVEASFIQWVVFFLPLYLSLTLTFKLILNSLPISGSISLGIIILLIMKGLDALSLVSGALTIISIGLLVSYFKKLKRTNLTSGYKIPKLTSLQRRKNNYE